MAALTSKSILRYPVLDPGKAGTLLVALYSAAVCRFFSDSSEGIIGIGYSVHEAALDLADNLVRAGVWIEVTARKE